MEHYEAIIIGFGKGGKLLAADLGKRGKKVALIERSAAMYGGTCINIACIPTKALIHMAKVAEYSQPDTFEEKAEAYRKAIAKKNEITAALRKKNFDTLNDMPDVDVITGVASFISPKEIEVTTETDKMTLSGDQIFIDTGAQPVIPPIRGIRESQRVYTSTTLMETDILPERLVIIGGGYIGLEFASMFAEFGSKVIVLETSSGIAGREDDDVAESVRKVLESKGIELRFNARVEEIQDTDEETIVHYRDNSAQEFHDVFADAVLVATGRKPATESLNPGAAGIATDERGAILVDERLKTTAPDVWAMGDVKGGAQFTYVSLDDFRIIRDQLFGDKKRDINDRDPLPYAVFIDPPLAHIGITEEEALRKGYSFKVSRLPATSVVRSRTLQQTDGMLKAIINSHSGKIMGCTLFCTDAPELINMVAMAMKTGQTSTFLRDFIFTHPSMSEGLNQLFDV